MKIYKIKHKETGFYINTETTESCYRPSYGLVSGIQYGESYIYKPNLKEEFYIDYDRRYKYDLIYYGRTLDYELSDFQIEEYELVFKGIVE